MNMKNFSSILGDTLLVRTKNESYSEAIFLFISLFLNTSNFADIGHNIRRQIEIIYWLQYKTIVEILMTIKKKDDIVIMIEWKK